jgi:hypothetical protein
MASSRASFWTIRLKSVVVHTVTNIVMGQTYDGRRTIDGRPWTGSAEEAFGAHGHRSPVGVLPTSVVNRPPSTRG